MTTQPQFDQPVILRRSPVFSRAIVWGLVGVTTFAVLWANLAPIDEAVSATGKLEPQGAVREIQLPLNGVVKEVHVKDGKRVKKGDLLITLDRESVEAQKESLQKIQAALRAESAFYRSEMGELPDTPQAGTFKPSLELATLTRNRATLISENRLYRALLAGDSSGSGLTPDQQSRLQSTLEEQRSRKMTAQLEANQLERQLQQIISQLASAKETLKINQGIFQNLKEVDQAGGIPKVQYLRQQQEVINSQSRVEQLLEEQNRIKLAIAQAREKLQNTVALSKQDLLTKLADNDKRLAEIDSQLKKAIVENDKKLAEINSQLKQAEQTLKYQELRAPADGLVFDLKAKGAGFVANPNSPEAVLKVVPVEALVVEAFIPNKDIGFVKPDADVDVRIDAFPFSEFGDIKGKVVSIGSDALPPTQIRPFYSFPAKIKLDGQSLKIRDRDVPLQSGMSVSVNIKVRKRTVMSIFTDGFMRQVDSFKSVR